MNVSLRSQMTAGVAALGAAVVAVAPITQPDLLPTAAQRVAAAVELSGYSNPVIAITDDIFYAAQYLLDQSFYGDAIWPDSFSGEYLYAPLNLGVLPDFANQFSTGPLSGLVNNLGGYGFAGITAALNLIDGVAGSAFNTPFAIVDAVQELIGGDPEAALQTLITAIVEPLQSAIDEVVYDVGYIVDNILGNIQTVVTFTIPFLVAEVVGAVVDNAGFILEGLADTAASFVANLAALDIEGAWNDIVDGILGPGGTVGDIIEVTIGIGLGEFNEQDEFVVNYPSIRSVVTSVLQRTGGLKTWGDGGITNDPLFGSEAESAAAVAPVTAVEAPSAAVESAPAAADEAPAAVTEAPAEVAEPAVSEVVAEVPEVTEAPVAEVSEPAPVSEPAKVSEPAPVGEAAADAPAAAEAPSAPAATAGDDDRSANTPKRAGKRSAR